jgi:hypothetical protein
MRSLSIYDEVHGMIYGYVGENGGQSSSLST